MPQPVNRERIRLPMQAADLIVCPGSQNKFRAAYASVAPFTLSMGCGTWGGNPITENLNYRHFINITHLVTTIPEDKPSEQDLFGAYWEKYGK